MIVDIDPRLPHVTKGVVFRSKRTSSGKEILYGTACYSNEEVEEYGRNLGFEVVDLPFDQGDYIPEPPKEAVPEPGDDRSEWIRKVWKALDLGDLEEP
jgi:hypothetical protein